MSYIVFARKYRPQTFEDIAGQSPVTTTLKNAILQDRVAHAYLFTGPRGVGKTTAARIFAKALNCAKGPRPDPCNACPSCLEITAGSSLDVLEIDGASNRGIDEIRNLRENVRFAPSKGRYKVYIIDEVHMLTDPAFNALLKTLEEPPAHVKFVFATTHVHKVPPTILSRCQRFDFRRIATKEIVANLQMIVKQEKLRVADAALAIIARSADGSMRNGQVILDQMVSSAGGKVEPEDVVRTLGLIDEGIIFGLAGAIVKKDAVTALRIIDRVVDEGKDMAQVAVMLIAHFRDLSLVKLGTEAEALIDAGAETVKRYRDEAALLSTEDILYVIYALANATDLMRRSALGRIPLEAALVKLTQAGAIMPLADVMKRLDALERQGTPASPVSPQPPVAPAPFVEKKAPLPPRQPEPPVAAPKPPAAAVAPAAPEAGKVPPPAADDVVRIWRQVIDLVMPKKISIASYLREASPVSAEGRQFTVGFPKDLKFYKEMVELPENRKLVDEAAKEAAGRDLVVTDILIDGAAPGHAAAFRDVDSSSAATLPTEGPAKEVDPIVKMALEMFGGEIANGSQGRGGAR